VAGITLDTGALIAVERGERAFGAYLRLAQRGSKTLVVPSAVLAQAWRGSRNARLGQFLNVVFVEPLTESLARMAGELLSRSATADIVDAMVVLTAAMRGDELVTSDMDDISRLAGFVSGLGPIRDLSKLNST
jgi:predicted nucleic acid-binding protein